MRLEPALRLWRACRYPLLVVALSRIVVVLLFAMEGWVTRPHGSGVGLPQMLRDLGSWDGIWYRSIAVHGYDPTIGHGDNAAFLPLYAESLFLVLVTGTFLLAERGRFLAASALGALGVLTRPVGIALAPALVWMAWGEREGRWKRVAPVALLPLAEGLFTLYLWWETGDPLAQTHAQARG